MIKIPLYLVSIPLDYPLIWNGSSLELSPYTFEQINQRISNLKQERLNVAAKIEKIKLDLGKIRRFDLFDIEYQIRLLEKQILKLNSLVKYANSSNEDMQKRVSNYESLLKTVNELYRKYQGIQDPILKEIQDNSGKISLLRTKISLLDPAIATLQAKGSQLEKNLSRIDRISVSISSLLTSVYNDISSLGNNNFQLSKVQAEIDNNIVLIDAKTKNNAYNIEIISSKLCDISLQFTQLYIELSSIITDFNKINDDVKSIMSMAQVAEFSLSRLSDNIDVLTNFYLEADEKIRAVESYLTSFIIGGDNVHLDFGQDYTVVHAIPPKIPPCPDPEPCPKSVPVVITPYPPGGGSGGQGGSGGSVSSTTKSSSTVRPTSAPTSAPIVTPVPKTRCHPSDPDYTGCFIVYCQIQMKLPNLAYYCDSEFDDNEVVDLECYWDNESRIEAQIAATRTANIYQSLRRISDVCEQHFKLIEVQDNGKCRVYYATDKIS